MKPPLYLFKKNFEREGKGWRKRGRETLLCGCLSPAPHWASGPQPRHVPWMWIEPVTLWFTGQHSIHWATPARAPPAVPSTSQFWCHYTALHLFVTFISLIDMSLLKAESRYISPWTLCKNIYIFRDIRRQGKREGEKRQLVASHTHPNQEPNLQPRHVPWPGVEPMTFHCVVWHLTNWTTPVRASSNS